MNNEPMQVSATNPPSTSASTVAPPSPVNTAAGIELKNPPSNNDDAPVSPSQIAADYGEMGAAIKDLAKITPNIHAPPQPPSQIAADYGEMDAAIKDMAKIAPNIHAPPLPPSQITAALQDDMMEDVEKNTKKKPSFATGNHNDSSPITQGSANMRVAPRNEPGQATESNTRRTSTVGRRSTLVAHVSATGETLIQATLVEEEEPAEVVIAEPMSYFARKWKMGACVIIFLMGALAVSVFLSILLNQDDGEKFVPSEYPSSSPSSSPSAPPSFDPRSTLEIVQERGYVRCGLRNETMESGMGPHLDLCRAVAAVLFGNPDSFVGVSVRDHNQFQRLHDRDIDVLLGRVIHTIEREVRERTTGSGFTFSTPYFYDGMAYFGEETFVKCAEEEKRFGACASLLICVKVSTTHHDFLGTVFPSDFIQTASSLGEMQEMLMNSKDDPMNRLNKSCNVIASDRSVNVWAELNSTAPGRDGTHFIEGEKTVVQEPLAIVTRNDDREFSDIINWVVQALFYGVEQGLAKKSALCQNYTNLITYHVSNFNFMNAVYCVGNHYEIWGVEEGMNRINNGTSGMIYATPFGQLDKEDDDLVDIGGAAGTTLHNIRENQLLKCGVVVPDGFGGVTNLTRGFVGMSSDYCRILAAAVLSGNYDLVNITTFSQNDNSSFAALNDGTIDVLAGARVEKKHDFGSPPSSGGVHFSTPYFYGNETASDDVSFFSLATREDDVMFSSFVNCVVLAPIYAREFGITRWYSKQMPSVSIFRNELAWALRDAIDYSGNYDEIYRKHFGSLSEAERGRNFWNRDGGPQIHSFPGLFVTDN